MFGWEFPPHISGGLGTACEGLTRALSADKVDLTFVVPRLFGSEDQSLFPIVSASEVPISMETLLSDAPANSVSSPTSRTISETTVVQGGVATKRVVVESPLLAYSSPASESGSAYTLDQWTVQWETVISNITVALSPTEQLLDLQKDISNNVAGSARTYTFSGTYGPDLISETLRYAEVAGEIARNEPHDIIHAHDWITFPAGLAAKGAGGKRLIVHVHATEIDRSGAHPHPVIFSIEKDGMHGADHVVAVSEWTKRILIKHYGVAPEKISVVHNGVKVKPRECTTPLPKLGTHYVTFLGRLTFQKGPLYFVQAAYKVLQRFPKAHFIVAGSGDMLGEMVELVAKLKLSKHVHFTGFLKGQDIDRVWSVTDLYVMPSVSEPFGITPLEASQAGVPAIVSNQSGVAEVMSHALKVDFWNVDELAAAICSVLAYPSLSKTLIEHGHEELQDITWEKASLKLKALYHAQVESVDRN
jgi:glycosyltransferase involved in cell wall biosynthesis